MLALLVAVIALADRDSVAEAQVQVHVDIGFHLPGAAPAGRGAAGAGGAVRAAARRAGQSLLLQRPVLGVLRRAAGT